MPLSRDAVRLEPGPSCVKQARRWAAQVCRELGRHDLVDAAELGVSELVTNAVLHATDPIHVRVRGTSRHPRLEVFDGSHHPPVLQPVDEPSGDDELDFLATIGRGLGLVAMNAAAWGADITTAGKVVWFEPTPEPRLDDDLAGEIFDATAAPRDAEDDVVTYDVELRALPLGAYRDFRRHYNELRREVRLLALAHEDAYPLARDLSRLFDTFERHLDVHASSEVDDLLARGEERADLTLRVGQPAADLAEQMIELLDLADAFCRAQRLLALARDSEQRTFQQWVLGEIARQGVGGRPGVWVPPVTVETSRASTA